MARKPDISKFKEWFAQSIKSMDTLLNDFACGKLNGTKLFKLYRNPTHGASILKKRIKSKEGNKQVVESKLNTAYHINIDYLQAPYTSDIITQQLMTNEYITSVIKLDLSDIIDGCASDCALKRLLSSRLVDYDGFDDIDDVIEYEFIGADVDGLYFKVRCYADPADDGVSIDGEDQEYIDITLMDNIQNDQE